jgi:hypothetical protein
MSELAAIAHAFDARLAPSTRGAILTVHRDDHWFTIFGRENPHLELVVDAPALVGLSFQLHLGRETLLGEDSRAAPVVDPRWRVHGARTGRLAELLAEPPWPAGTEADLPFFDTIGNRPSDGWSVQRTPRYFLTVEDGQARIERRTSEIEPALAIGATRRLLQLVTRPHRLRAPAPPARGTTGAPYR